MRVRHEVNFDNTRFHGYRLGNMRARAAINSKATLRTRGIFEQ